MSNTISLLETKLKKHDWYWSESSSKAAQDMGKANFDEIQRLCAQAVKEGQGAEAMAMFKRYQKK